MKKYAVIDLGTNTFHLLVVETVLHGTFKELYRNRVFVQLAEEGIQTIGKAPFDRGINALKSFKATLDELNVSTLKVFGTAALRTASNGVDFIQTVYKETGIHIQLISGDQEAELIYKGVNQAVDFENNTVLIMDIGGGSVEFIIADQTEIKWAQSFPIGVSVLYHRFHKTDPISNTDINLLIHHLSHITAPLIEQLKTYTPTILIGASGTFDVLETVLCKEKITNLHGMVKVTDFYPLYHQWLKTTLQERFNMPEIPNTRAQLIIVALILIHFVLELTKIQKISISAYAMKEGMLKELIALNEESISPK